MSSRCSCCCCHDVFLINVDVETCEQFATLNVNPIGTGQTVQSIHCIRVQLLRTSQQLVSANNKD